MGYGQNHYITSTGWDWGPRVTTRSEHRDIGVFLFLYSWQYQEHRIFYFTAALCVLNGSNGDGFFLLQYLFARPSCN